MTALPTREQIDAAEPIDSDAKRNAAQPARAYPARSYAIEAISPAGFRISITLTDIRLDALDDALGALLERGYMPYEPPAPATANPTQPAAAPTQQAVCQYHGPMKESTIKGKEGTYYCTKKMADGSYCKETWPPKR